MSTTESKSEKEIYEQELHPLLGGLEDPFRSLDLEEKVEYSSNFIGRVLSEASKSEEYEIERHRVNNTSYYTLEGREPERAVKISHEDEELIDEIVKPLEEGETEEITENELERLVSEELDCRGATLGKKASKAGKIKDYLKLERVEVSYYPEESVFKLEE